MALATKFKMLAGDDFRALTVGHGIRISHNFFVDDILVFSMIYRMMWETLHNIFYRFGRASGILINKGKPMLLYGEGQQEDIGHIANLFGVKAKPISSGLKYLDFNIKPNNSRVNDWLWIVDKFHKKISRWEHRCLKIGGRVTITQSILQQLTIYWAQLYCLLATTITKINKIIVKFIWVGPKKSFKFHLTKMEKLTKSKSLGG